MTDYTNELDQLFNSLAQETEKVAEDTQVEDVVAEINDDSQTKLAEDLYAGGEIMANGFVDQVLEKLAAAAPAAGGGSAVPVDRPRSRWEQVAARLGMQHGRKLSPGDDTSVRAEDKGYPGAGSQTAVSGHMGSANPQKSLG